jgi:hypothetical protein
MVCKLLYNIILLLMIGNESDISLEILKFKPLKSVYVDVETRAKYREKIL